MTPTEARALWYIGVTGGYTDQIADAMHLGGIPTMGILLRLKDAGYAQCGYFPSEQRYRWFLTPQGLAEHERRMNRANRIAAGDT